MFPADYVSSRAQFRAAAARRGWRLDAQGIDGTAPNGEELTIDAAISPALTSDRVLVVSSGLHGVEGPIGAAVQIALLESWAQGARPTVQPRIVLLHALNPFGYAWSRRVDAGNVDPNRNFLLPGERFSGSAAGYRYFDSLLNPRYRPRRWDFFLLRSWLAILRHGLPALKQALVVGQYDYPKGVFFGGHGPCPTQIALRERLRAWIGPARQVLHLDFHTGLGRWGSGKLLLDNPLTPELRARMDRWFGPGTWEEDNPNGVAYRQRGSFGAWCLAQGLAEEYLYAVAEFGTYGNVTMLAGLRAENQAFHWGRARRRAEKKARRGLRELFCPADPVWRERVLKSGLSMVERALTALNESAMRQATNAWRKVA